MTWFSSKFGSYASGKSFRTTFIAFLLLCSSFLLSQESAHKERAAIIIASHGDVTLKTPTSINATKALTDLDLLRGDSVFVGNESTAGVLLMDGTIVMVRSDTKLYVDSTRESSLIIEENSKRTISDNDILNVCEPKVFIASSEERDSALKTKLPRERTTRGDITPSILPLLPAKTIYNSTPTFIWYDPRPRLKRNDVKHYTLVIYESFIEGNEITYKQVVQYTIAGKTFTLNKFTLPEPLAYSSTYEWDIYASGETPKENEDMNPRGRFSILDSLRAMEIKRTTECFLSELDKKTIDENTYYLLLGSYLKKKNLPHEAALAYEELGERLNNAYPFEELAVLYKRFGDDTALLLNETLKKAQNK